MIERGKRWMIAVACALGLVVALPAKAGMKVDYPVTFYSGSNTVTGSVGSARAGAGNQYIGCSSYGNVGYCVAEDIPGNTFKLCTWTGTTLASAVASMTAFSYVSFSWDNSGNCTSIFVANYSDMLPIAP